MLPNFLKRNVEKIILHFSRCFKKWSQGLQLDLSQDLSLRQGMAEALKLAWWYSSAMVAHARIVLA